MTKLLYVNGCTRQQSRTEKLTRNYLIEILKENNITLEEINVHNLDILPMNEDDIKKREEDTINNNFDNDKYILAKQFRDANIIVVSAPYWDCSFPSKLKVYFEHICVNNITFAYDENGNLMKKCMADKLVYVTTAGGYIRKHSSVQLYMEELCTLLGISDFRFYCAEALDIFPNKVEEILKDTLLHMLQDLNEASPKKIPNIKMPEICSYKIESKDEELVSLKDRGFCISSQYYQRRLPGSFPDCYVRKSVASMLEKAQELLPKGIRFKIYDGYRPLSIQKALWDYFIKVVRERNPKDTEEEIKIKTSYFVSEPSYNIDLPSLHNTGGAIDLSLIYEDGDNLDMGTSFDSFKETAWSSYFEMNNSNIMARENRRILYYAMIEAGFTNLPSEWWHYEYGTKFWSYFKGRPALYKGIIDIKLPEQI